MVNFIYAFKEQGFGFVDFCYGFFCFFCIYFCPNFKISFLLLTLGFFISSISSCFRCRVRLFSWLFSYFMRYAYIAMNLPVSTAFTVSHTFWVVVFSFWFVSMHIFISFFYFFCDLLVIQQRVVQPPYVGIFNSFSPVIEI